ncbi:MAG: ABC-F family ATP-binding cassette domain-containing protein [Clostridia bacterium]|nr:ABC-F family ATP-binding cassette domain-containing protein [Clostridia bacterium]
MIILDVNKLGINFGYGQLFDGVSFSLNEGESISIVGPNGCGKSTMLKIIAGIERADSGQVSIKKGAKVAYLDQTGSSTNDDREVYEILKDAFKELTEMEKKLEEMQKKLESGIEEDEYNSTLEKYCNLMEEFSMAGGYDMDTTINTVVEGLKIDKNLLKQSYNDLSGGEKTLVQLAKALIIKPDLILLDEPTNHLDIERIEWLEGYIKSFKGASVIVSHDRYFLDKMSNKILDLDNGVGKVYTSNYSGYVEEKQRDFEKQMADYKDQQAIIKKLDEQRKYFAERGMATNSSTLCDRAHALQTQIDRLKKAAVARPVEKKKLNVGFSEERKSSQRVIVAEDLTVNLPDGRKILDGIDVSIYAGERVALIGSNGSGKSTFLKTVLGVQDLEKSGDIIIGPSVKIGYLPQIITFPKPNQQLLEYFSNAVGLNEQRARQILAGFQFYKEDVTKKVESLSGGERMRVKLAELLQQRINTLIFDEPTNHIDIPTKEVLEEAIEEFDGTLVFVSHDRYFINKFAQKIFEFENGSVTPYIGNYDDYKKKKEMGITDSIEDEHESKKNRKKDKAKDDDWER